MQLCVSTFMRIMHICTVLCSCMWAHYTHNAQYYIVVCEHIYTHNAQYYVVVCEHISTHNAQYYVVVCEHISTHNANMHSICSCMRAHVWTVYAVVYEHMYT